MRMTVFAGTVVVATGAFGAAALLWPEKPVNYQPTILTEAEILAEKPRFCESVPAFRDNCLRTSAPVQWKVGLINRVCSEKTGFPGGGTGDWIGNAEREIEHWRCVSQFVAVNGKDVEGLPALSRSRTVSGAWDNLSYHWKFDGISARPLDFSAAIAKTVRFSLGH